MNVAKNVLLINGPNLNLLGKREPGIYGAETLESVIVRLKSVADRLGVNLSDFQSNSEGAIVDRIHQAMGKEDFIVINPGAYTHTSIAIRDAFLGTKIPFIEVHISNIFKREEFRHHSYLSDVASGVICGLGTDGYEFALTKAIRLMEKGDATI